MKHQAKFRFSKTDYANISLILSIILVILVFISVFISTRNTRILSMAFTASKFDNVEVAVDIRNYDISDEMNLENQMYDHSMENISNQQEEYSEDGDIEADDTEEEESANYTDSRLAVIEKKDNILHEYGDFTNECYYYEKDGKNYYAYYKRESYFDTELKLVTEEVSDTTKDKFIDFDKLSGLKGSNFKYKDGVYTPKSSSQEKVAMAVLNIDEEGYNRYTDIEVRLYLENKRISRIEVDFILNTNAMQSLIYNFKYDSISKIEIEDTKTIQGGEK